MNMKIWFSESSSLNSIKTNVELLQLIKLHHPGRSESLKKIQEVVLREAIQREVSEHSTQTLQTLIAMGYAPEHIAEACALALYNEHDFFVLEHRDFFHKYWRTSHLIYYSIFIAIALIILIFNLLKKSQSSFISTLLIFEPLLALVGILISLITFKLLKYVEFVVRKIRG